MAEPTTILSLSDGSEFGTPSSTAYFAASMGDDLVEVELAYGEGTIWINPLQITTVRQAEPSDYYRQSWPKRLSRRLFGRPRPWWEDYTSAAPGPDWGPED